MSTLATQPAPQTGADLLVKSLEAQGVEYIFGIPGAKIDKVFDTLLDSKIKTVVCRHEQNAAFNGLPRERTLSAGIPHRLGCDAVSPATHFPFENIHFFHLVISRRHCQAEHAPLKGIGHFQAWVKWSVLRKSG
jgi:hypothetical protein